MDHSHSQSSYYSFGIDDVIFIDDNRINKLKSLGIISLDRFLSCPVEDLINFLQINGIQYLTLLQHVMLFSENLLPVNSQPFSHYTLVYASTDPKTGANLVALKSKHDISLHVYNCVNYDESSELVSHLTSFHIDTPLIFVNQSARLFFTQLVSINTQLSKYRFRTVGWLQYLKRVLLIRSEISHEILVSKLYSANKSLILSNNALTSRIEDIDKDQLFLIRTLFEEVELIMTSMRYVPNPIEHSQL